jgi:hypothetical protein
MTDQILQSLSLAAKNFNRCLSDLLDCVKTKSKDDEIANVCEKFSAIKSIESESIPKTAGPHLWKYRKEIMEKNEDFFLKNSYTEDIKENKSMGQSEIQKLISSCKKIWEIMSTQEKEICWTHLKGCIQNYASYLGCSKKLLTSPKKDTK